jgi:MoxR-like ATPase
MDTQAYAALARRLTEGAARALTGKEKETRLLLCALAAGGHVLLEYVPGTARRPWPGRWRMLMGLHFAAFSARRTCCPRT